MEYLANVTGIQKHYEDFNLNSVELSVEPGTVVGLIGANGAGKTTLLKALLGLITIDGGTAELLGQPVSSNSKVIDSLKSRIGVVLDTCAFPSACRVADVGILGSVAYSTWDSAKFHKLCKLFGLAPKKQVQELSRGMGMKLTLSFALAHNPELLILDEATAGLDPIAREELLDLLRQFMEQPGKGILMSTHITSDLEKIADEIVCIDNGAVIFNLPKDQITDEAGIAHLRTNQVEKVLASDALSQEGVRIMRGSYSTEILVCDRFAFARAFPDIPIEAPSIEEYMAFMLKGESR